MPRSNFLKSVSNFMLKFSRKFFQKILKILPKIPKILPKILKIYHFLIDFFTLAGVPFLLEQSSILLGRIHASDRLSNNKELVHFHSKWTTKYYFCPSGAYHEEGKEDQLDEPHLEDPHQKLVLEWSSERANKSARLPVSSARVLLYLQTLQLLEIIFSRRAIPSKIPLENNKFSKAFYFPF